MVTESDLRPVIESIGDSYPSFAGWYGNLTQAQRDGIKASWVRQLSSLEPEDVRGAAGEILDGRVDMPKNYEFDRLGVLLRTWGNVEASRRIEKENTDQLRQQARPAADPSVKGVNYRFGPAIKCASAWGAALRGGYVSQAENDTAMEIIDRYHKRGDVALSWPVLDKGKQSLVDFWKTTA